MNVSEYIVSNPTYIIVVVVCIFIVYRVIREILKDDKDDDDNDNGGIMVNDPKLDLPPGVSLPVEQESALVS